MLWQGSSTSKFNFGKKKVAQFILAMRTFFFWVSQPYSFCFQVEEHDENLKKQITEQQENRSLIKNLPRSKKIVGYSKRIWNFSCLYPSMFYIIAILIFYRQLQIWILVRVFSFNVVNFICWQYKINKQNKQNHKIKCNKA